MKRRIYNLSFDEIAGRSLRSISSNESIALVRFDRYDYKKLMTERNLLREAMTIEAVTISDVQGYFTCIVQGKLCVEINKRRYELSLGDCASIFKGDYYKIVKVSEDIELFSIINRSSDYMFGVNNTLLLLSFREKLKHSRCFKVQTFTMNVLVTIYDMMKKALDDDTLIYKDAIIQEYQRILFYYISSELMRDEALQPTASPSRQEELLFQFMQLVGEHFKEERKVKFYADLMCLTPKYLSTIIYETSGRYARDIISDFVITEAKRCLLNTTMSVQEIGDYLNFSCQSFFGKYFREHAGVSPQEYRISVR